jgi:hypothetical protein
VRCYLDNLSAVYLIKRSLTDQEAISNCEMLRRFLCSLSNFSIEPIFVPGRFQHADFSSRYNLERGVPLLDILEHSCDMADFIKFDEMLYDERNSESLDDYQTRSLESMDRVLAFEASIKDHDYLIRGAFGRSHTLPKESMGPSD